MNDSISRKLAIDSIMAAGKIGKLTCCDILRKLPSAWPEQKHGKWMIEVTPSRSIPSDTKYTCSRCGYIKSRQHGEILNYCPNCGAKMNQ